MRNGYRALAAGGRNQTYDVEVLEVPVKLQGFDHLPGIGRYEVKRLRKSGTRSYDRRFKTSGARGSRMYGRTDALIKAAALEIERIPHLRILLEEVDHDEIKSTELIHRVLDDAIENRHSHRFQEAFPELCKLVLQLHDAPFVREYLVSQFTSDKIVSGYRDLDGLFIIRGDTYTLIKRDKIPQHIGFDSFGCEGLKLRVLGVVSDATSVVGKVKGRKR